MTLLVIGGCCGADAEHMLAVADRCRSCHIGIDNPDAPVNEPLTPHPELGQHTFPKFGCTVCHAGDGYATRLPDAHQELLPRSIIEASCGKCHDSERVKEEAPTLIAGQNLADRYNCNGCHQIADRERRKYSGPGVNGLSTKVSAKWLAQWLKEPKKYLPYSRIGNFLLSDEERAPQPKAGDLFRIETDVTGHLEPGFAE